MSFPLLPILPQNQGTKHDVTPAIMLDPEQVPFTLFFELENTVKDQSQQEPAQEDLIVEEAEPIPEIGPVEGDNSEQFSVTEIPIKPPTKNSERQAQSLLESVFTPVSATPSLTTLGLFPNQKTPQTQDIAPPPPQQSDATAAIINTFEKPAELKALIPQAENKPTKTTPRADPLELLQKAPVSRASLTLPTIDAATSTERSTPTPLAKPLETQQPAIVVSAMQSAALPTTAKAPKDPKVEAIERSTNAPVHAQTRDGAVPPTQPHITAPQPTFVPMANAPLPKPVEHLIGDKLADLPLAQGVLEGQTNNLSKVAIEPSQQPAQTQQVAKSVANQMAVAMAQTSSGATELILSPEELGRVRMVMSTQDGGITVLIQTERPETNDLLRRHIEVLSQEFKSLGYNSTKFTFAQNQQQSSDQKTGSHDTGILAVDDTADNQLHAMIATSEGLDLRL